MSTSLRVLRGAIEKFRQYNEELLLRKIAYGTRGGTIDPQTYWPRLRRVISLLKGSATKKVCKKHALKSRFFLGLTLSFSFPFDELCEASCVLAFFVTVVDLFSSPSSLSFCLLLLIPTLFPEAVAICTRSQD